MNQKLRKDIDCIVENTIKEVLPDEAVTRALNNFSYGKGKVILVAAGKAAWQMVLVRKTIVHFLDSMNK